MNYINKTIIDAVIKKANALCPNSLALIGVYGSVATGDEHEKSDLDLMILINDENGWVLAAGFILDDVDVGYDIYCTSWDMLERDAQCNHAHLSKLFDAKIVYCKDQSALEKLDEIKKKAAELLASDKRYDKANNAYCEAKKMFAESYLTESLSKVRSCAGIAIAFIEDAVMLYNGQYFRKGTKRAFEELRQLKLPFDLETIIVDIIRAETVETIRERLKKLLVLTKEYLQVPTKKELPSATNLCGTYEEMYSNWKNKMSEAADRDDVYSSFMNLLSLQHMFYEISEGISVDNLGIMDKFDSKNLEKNVSIFNKALNNYLAEYEKVGISPKRFRSVEEFAEDYCKTIHKMQKVIVIGCPGSGKSTFSKALHNLTGLPLYHLDMMKWNADGTYVPKSTFMERLHQVLKKESWIIDGNYSSTMELRMQFCDTVFFLDYPTDICIAGIKSRKGKERTDIPCTTLEDEDYEFVEFIKNYNSVSRPAVLELLHKYSHKRIIIFENRNKVSEFLSQISGGKDNES